MPYFTMVREAVFNVYSLRYRSLVD